MLLLVPVMPRPSGIACVDSGHLPKSVVLGLSGKHEFSISCTAVWLFGVVFCLELDGPGLGSNRQRIFAPVVESSGMTGLDRFVHAERDTACLYADCDTTSYCTYVCTCIASLQADVFEVRGDLLTLHRGFIGLLCDLVVFNASSCCHC